MKFPNNLLTKIIQENEKYKQFVAKLEKVEYIEEKASSFNIKLNQDIKKVCWDSK